MLKLARNLKELIFLYDSTYHDKHRGVIWELNYYNYNTTKGSSVSTRIHQLKEKKEEIIYCDLIKKINIPSNIPCEIYNHCIIKIQGIINCDIEKAKAIRTVVYGKLKFYSPKFYGFEKTSYILYELLGYPDIYKSLKSAEINEALMYATLY